MNLNLLSIIAQHCHAVGKFQSNHKGSYWNKVRTEWAWIISGVNTNTSHRKLFQFPDIHDRCFSRIEVTFDYIAIVTQFKSVSKVHVGFVG